MLKFSFVSKGYGVKNDFISLTELTGFLTFSSMLMVCFNSKSYV